MELQNKENTNLPLYEKRHGTCRNRHPEYAHAIQAGILTSSIKECWKPWKRKERAEARIAEERLANLKLSPIRKVLTGFGSASGPFSKGSSVRELIDTSINAIYRYDDKMLITFNDKEGTETFCFYLAV